MTPPRKPARILVGPALRAQPDRRLVTLAREGHGPAVEEMVRRYRPALVRYAATIVPADRADDVVQDSIARALPRIRDGDAELHLRPWLFTIVRNTALNNLRDAGPAMDSLDEGFDGVEQPPQALERREEMAAVVAGVRALPDSQREALIKREMEGRSHREIGDAMGVSVAAARQLIHRGRVSLRESLGVLIPMPVIRQLLEGLGAPAATGAGGALAAKALVGVLAVGGAVGAGVALDRHSHPPARAATIVAQNDASPQSAAGGDDAASLGGRAGGGEPGSQGGPEPDRGPRGSLESSRGSDDRRVSEDSGTRTGSGPEDSGHGGGEGGHHGSLSGGEHSGEPAEGGHLDGGGGSGGGGGGSGPSGETEGGSGDSGGSGHSDDPVSHQGPGETPTGSEGSSGPGGGEPEARTDSSGLDD